MTRDPMVLLLILVVALVVAVVTLVPLRMILMAVPEKHRLVRPSAIWALFIPLFNLYWIFHLTRAIAGSYRRAFEAEKLGDKEGLDRFEQLGTAWSIALLASAAMRFFVRYFVPGASDDIALFVTLVPVMIELLLMTLFFATGLGLRRELLGEGKEDEPSEEAEPALEDGELPLWHAVTVYIMAPLIPALAALLFVGTKDHDSLLRWNRTDMTLGVFRLSYAQQMVDPTAWGEPSELIYYNDGLTTTVTVERWGQHYALKNNGKVDASNGDDMPTQVNVAAYPLLLHERGPSNLDVAVIGFGSGVSVGTALGFPVRRVDVIELERSIPEAARVFEDVNHLRYTLDHWPYVQMDRLSIINDDGRNYLASTSQDYDVIISEPSNPWITGVSDLFTVEHWRIAKGRLRPGGIFCQWVQLYELSPENIKSIYRTFASQFRYVVVLAADYGSSDTVMLGSDRPIRFDLARVRRAYRLRGVSDNLERGNIFSPFDVFARTLLASRGEVLRYAQNEYHREGTERWLGLFERTRWEEDLASTNSDRCGRSYHPPWWTFDNQLLQDLLTNDPRTCRREPAELNTDDNARIEFAAPNDLIGFARYEGYLRDVVYSHAWPYGSPIPLLAGFGSGEDASRNYAELAMSMIAHRRYQWAGDVIERSERAARTPETSIAIEVFRNLISAQHEPAVRVEPPIPGPDMDRETAEQLVRGFDQVRDAIDAHDYATALSAIEEIPEPLRLHSGPGMRLLYAYLLYKGAFESQAYYRRAAEVLEDLAGSDEDYVVRHPEVYYYLARCREEDDDSAGALRAMRAYVEARLVPVEGGASDVPEPPPGQAPSTDAPGESPKLEHDEQR